MSTLAEIESAADLLPAEQKEELVRFLTMRLREASASPKIGERRSAGGRVSDWLQAAKGSVRAAAGESADDVRMDYYSAKYGVRP